jgi:lambda family phage portal protein
MAGEAKKHRLSNAFGSVWDGLIGVFSPARATRNRRVRAMDDFWLSMTKYDGAVMQAFGDWYRASGESADDALLPELAILRQRSRDLLRNNPVAISNVDALVKNVIGKGLRPQSRIDWQTVGIASDKAKAIQRQIEVNWRDHCGKAIDFEDTLTFPAMQRMAFRKWAEDGEAFLIRRYVDPSERPWARYGTCWQMVEADCVMTPPDRMGDPNIRCGIELGKRGHPVAYHVTKRHPGDSRYVTGLTADQFERIPAYDAEGRPQVIHLFVKLRPNQTRGVPILAAIVETLLSLKEGFNNELVSMKVSAMLAYFIKCNDPIGDMLANTDTTITGTSGDGASTLKRLEKAFAGMIMRLQPNEDVVAHVPQRPSNTFKDYITFCIRWVGSALGVPYEKSSHDWSQTTYTSGRMAEIDFGGSVDVHQQFFTEGFCQPTFEMSVEEQMLRGDIPALRDWRRRKSAWCKCQWIAPARPWVDPLKDVTAKGIALDRNLTTLAQECAELGYDWEEVVEQRHEERMLLLELQGEYQKRMTELGVAPEPEPAGGAKPDEGEESGKKTESAQALAIRLIEAEYAGANGGANGRGHG